METLSTGIVYNLGYSRFARFGYAAGVENKKPNRIEEIRKSRNMSGQKLADAIGTTRSQIYKLENGERGLDTDWMRRIAKALHCAPSDLISEGPQTVQVVGYVGAGSEVYPIDDHEKGGGLEEVDCPPGEDPLNTVALRIKGDSMLPMLKENWIIYYNERIEGNCENQINKLCVVQVQNGPVLVKEVKRGYTKGKFNLFSYNAALIEDVRLDWCAPIIFIKPA